MKMHKVKLLSTKAVDAVCSTLKTRVPRLRGAVLVLLLSSLLLLAYARVSVANWYTGNHRYDAYGVQANIHMPSTAPNLEESGQNGESNYVSLPPDNWVQAGWRYYWWYGGAQRYVEHYVNGNYGIDPYGTQAWGSTVNYKVGAWAGGNVDWLAYIDGDYKGGWGPISAPQTVQAFSEVHESSQNELNTHFSSVSYKGGDWSWHYFDQWNFYFDRDSYDIHVYRTYDYRTYGPQ